MCCVVLVEVLCMYNKHSVAHARPAHAHIYTHGRTRARDPAAARGRAAASDGRTLGPNNLNLSNASMFPVLARRRGQTCVHSMLNTSPTEHRAGVAFGW